MRHFYTRLCGIIFLISLGLLIADLSTINNQLKTGGQMIALDSNQKLPVVINGDTTFVNLAKGDSLRILGFTRLTTHQDVLVETQRGDRGELDASQLPIRQLVVKGDNKGDTIVSLVPEYIGKSHYVHEYKARTAKGEELELKGEDFAPICEGWEDYNLLNNASTSITTQRTLEKCKGKTLEEIEKKFGMAYDVIVNADGSKEAGFRIYTYGSDGKIYTPAIAFDSKGLATGFSYDLLKSKAKNSWLLGNPLADGVISMPLIRLLTKSDSYGTPSNHTGKATPWYIYVLLVVGLLALAVWYLLVPSLPTLLMGWLIAYPIVFKPLNNRMLKLIMMTATVLCTGIWMVALMGWGMHWFFTLLVIPVSYYCLRWATEYLDDYVPHQRCPQCKHIESIEFDHDEVTDTKYMKGSDIKRDKLLSTHDERYQTWTEVTTKWSDGSKTVSKKDVRNHKRRHDTYRYIDFEVTYFVTFYLNHFYCKKCKYHETSTSTTQEEVDRKVVGSHSGTESYEV